MRETQTKLVISLVVWCILVLSSATEDLVVVDQCKNQCKYDLHNMKECEAKCNKKMTMMMKQDPFCDKFCKAFLEDGEGSYGRCMIVCPRTKQEMMPIEGGFNGVANRDLQTICNRRCSSYTTNKRCMSQCFKSMIGKMMDNEAVCESSCRILQESPLIIRCTRFCHEIIPGAIDMFST